MTFICPESPPIKGRRFLTSLLKNAFFNCRFPGRLSGEDDGGDKHEGGGTAADIADELEVTASAIRARALEAKLMRRKANSGADSLWWVFSSATGELLVGSNGERVGEGGEVEGEEFVKVGSRFPEGSGSGVEDFASLEANLGGIWRWDGFGIEYVERRSVIRELCHCEGWPFGLGRKALLLPPLPKSPTQSCLWRKGARFAKFA